MMGNPALCHCGLKLHHKGWHKGQNQPHQSGDNKTKPSRDTKLRTLVEQSIAACHARILRLKTDIRSAQAELLDVETKLHPLVALLDTYKMLALPAPERTKTVQVPVKTVSVALTPVESKARASAKDELSRDAEDDYTPQEVTYGQVVAWAAVRNITFKTWDDLPAINRRREEFELPLFKRKMTAFEIGKHLS